MCNKILLASFQRFLIKENNLNSDSKTTTTTTSKTTAAESTTTDQIISSTSVICNHQTFRRLKMLTMDDYKS